MRYRSWFWRIYNELQACSAFYEHSYIFPPSKEIAFNAQLNSNDGLLVSYIAESDKLSYDEALAMVKSRVTIWNQQLEQNECLVLKQLGELWINSSQKIQFQPSLTTNYLTESFGLTSFVSQEITREVLKQEVASLEEKAPIRFTPEKRRIPAFVKYAAVLALTASLGLVGMDSYQQQQQIQLQIVEQEAQAKVAKTIQQATFFDAEPIELPSLKLNIIKEPMPYHVVAGAFRVSENADKKVEELKAEGYKASKVGVNKYGLHQVAYQSFATMDAANAFLEILKTKQKEGWVLISE